MKKMRTLTILVLAVILLLSFVVLANAQDKKVVKKVVKTAEKVIKTDKGTCPHSTAKCSDKSDKACCAKGDKVHIKNAKATGECCSKASADCNTKCEPTKVKKENK